MDNYWDKEYPTHIEIPEGYWVCSHNVDIEWNKKIGFLIDEE